MVLQITTYRTKDSAQNSGTNLERLKAFYLNNGCAYYEVVNDVFSENSILQITRFESKEMAERFHRLESLEKKQLLDKFYEDHQVISQSDEVKFVE